MWVLGSVVTAAGTAVYIEFGTVRYLPCTVGAALHVVLA